MRIPTRSLLLQYEIGTHTAARKIFDSIVVFSPVSMRVIVARSAITDIFEKLHEPESRLWICRTEAQILIVTPRYLIIQVYVEELAGFPCLRDRMSHVQTGHMLVRYFRVYADHIGMIKGWDEAEVS